jgi:hypothetical protein
MNMIIPLNDFFNYLTTATGPFLTEKINAPTAAPIAGAKGPSNNILNIIYKINFAHGSKSNFAALKIFSHHTNANKIKKSESYSKSPSIANNTACNNTDPKLQLEHCILFLFNPIVLSPLCHSLCSHLTLNRSVLQRNNVSKQHASNKQPQTTALRKRLTCHLGKHHIFHKPRAKKKKKKKKKNKSYRFSCAFATPCILAAAIPRAYPNRAPRKTPLRRPVTRAVLVAKPHSCTSEGKGGACTS